MNTRTFLPPIVFAVGLFLSGLPTTAQGTEKSFVPRVFFDFWNFDNIRSRNNCYNYASNRQTDNYAQPGEASGKMYKSFTCPDVASAASNDLGLVPTAFFPYRGKEDDLLVALVVAPGWDFHWYRRGDDNMWTHKMGGTAASNLDNSGMVIPSPETANRGRYTEFCGYFRIKNFIREADEQNGGYVRIGNMPNLPPTDSLRFGPQSSVQMLIFSGRPDPVIPLRQVIKYLDLQGLRQVSAAMRTGQAVGNRIRSMPPSFLKLGYRGIQILDREGLFFPRGTLAQIRGDFIFVERSKVPEIQWTRISGLALVEQKIVAEIRKTYP